MRIDWEKVEGVIAGLADAEELKARLNTLKAATAAAEQVEKLKVKYETGNALRHEAAMLLVRLNERETELDRREAALGPKEKELHDREKLIALREDELGRRERLVEQKREHLVEVAHRAAQ